ncbi:MAG: hypothetical protein IPK08_17150 [Bacteroidetes bacterium]|nr:hypothetical protein [Bacteroidota bacterium]
MNIAALRSGDILLKENNTNKLWRIKNSNGTINCPNPIEINYEKATSSIAEDVSDVSEDKIYLSAVGGWDAPELIIYSLSSTEIKQLLSFGLTDISIRKIGNQKIYGLIQASLMDGLKET